VGDTPQYHDWQSAVAHTETDVPGHCHEGVPMLSYFCEIPPVEEQVPPHTSSC
jgi:hypothetical protein